MHLANSHDPSLNLILALSLTPDPTPRPLPSPWLQVHIHGEVVFDQQQGLWFMADGWEKALEAPGTKDFMAWLKSQHNGLRAGQGVTKAIA